jgi:hypothetical protein
MITIPVAAPINLFKWQISLFQFAQRCVYGDDANNNSLILIVDRNDSKTIVTEIDWDLKLPYKIVKGIHSIINDDQEYNPNYAAGNVFFALKGILNETDDDEIFCIIDSDIIPNKKYTGVLPNDDAVVTCNFYENWHMKCSRPDKENYNVVEPFLKHDIHEYMDGGFAPILIKSKTLKLIIDEVIDLSLKFAINYKNSPFGWWMQMWAFQIACHNNHIKCVGQDNTYFPHINEYNQHNHYFTHYSCDPLFRKGTFPNHNISEFPYNYFYNLLREWYSR